MKEIFKHRLSFLLALLVFIYWLSLSFANYFHYDEWDFFTKMNGSAWEVITKSYSGHFIPLNLLHHFLLFKIFGLNYVPFQVSTILFHTLNSLILYFVVFRLTRQKYLSLISMALFAFSSIGIENIIWSLGVNYCAAGFFLFASFFLFLFIKEKLDFKKLLISLLFLVLSPLFHGITLLMPLAFAVSALLCFSKKYRLITFLSYITICLFNILIFIFNSNFSGIENNSGNYILLVFNIVRFVITGVVGVINKFFAPALYFFPQSQSVIGLYFRPFFFTLGVISFLIFFIFFRRRFYLKDFLLTFPFIAVSFLAASFGRQDVNFSMPTISRYGYLPLFFFILYLSLLTISFRLKKSFVYLLFIIILGLHLLATYNFSFRVWKPLVNTDRIFITDVNYLFSANNQIVDFPVNFIYNHLKLSNFWFVSDYNKEKFVELSSGKSAEIINSSDLKTKEIYKNFLKNL